MHWPKRLAIICGATALLASLLLGVWELAQPVFVPGAGRFALSPSSPPHMWSFALLQAIKPAGFLAGLLSLYITATNHGMVTRSVLVLAALASLFAALAWIMVAITGRDDALYLGGHPFGSDARTNGGAIVFWLAPIFVGVSVFTGRRAASWQSAWLIVVGVFSSRLFADYPPGVALIIEGILWLTVAVIAYRAAVGGRSVI